MAFVSAVNPPNGLHRLPLPSSRNERPSSNMMLQRQFPTRFPSTLALARRRSNRAEVTPSKMKIKKKKEVRGEEEEEESVDEDAIDALFTLLEEDLKLDDKSLDDDDFSEEELAKLEQELKEAFGVDDDDDDDDDDDEDDEVEDEDEDEDVVIESGAQADEDEDDEEEAVKLKTWQLRRLAAALKVGRRKTSIKVLAAELCLERPVVLELLRNPPPSLLMMCATLPDEPAPKVSVSQSKPVETVVETTVVETVVETTTDTSELQTAVKVPVHVMQQKFSAQKRLKKAQVETLESVYRRTKRPTNAMISSIVHVTNLPRKRVVKWFEDKRSDDGVPDSRLPYQRSSPNTA